MFTRHRTFSIHDAYNLLLNMRLLWIKAAAILVGIWLIAGGAIWWAHQIKPTPESLMRYIDTHSLDGKSKAERTKIIGKVTDQLNGLGYDERREVRMGKNLDHFFKSLDHDEQGLFLDQTLPAGFKQMMDAFNNMASEKRKQFVEKALTDMKKHEGEEVPKNDDPNVQKIMQQGLHAFYSEANADVKMDLSPLLEQMQKNLQGGGR